MKTRSFHSKASMKLKQILIKILIDHFKNAVIQKVKKGNLNLSITIELMLERKLKWKWNIKTYAY